MVISGLAEREGRGGSRERGSRGRGEREGGGREGGREGVKRKQERRAVEGEKRGREGGGRGRGGRELVIHNMYADLDSSKSKTVASVASLHVYTCY